MPECTDHEYDYSGKMIYLPDELSLLVYRVLVEECGFKNSANQMIEFMEYAWREGISEYRFIGHMGMGGKLHLTEGGFYVDCYMEDLTELRAISIEKANKRLKDIHQQYINS